VAQAEGLNKLLGEMGTPLDAVVLLEVDTEQLVKRVSGRRTCEFCKKVFNIHFAPPSGPVECVPGRTEHSLIQRPDDREETFKERLRKYEDDTRKPVSHYYAYTGLMRTVDAEGSIDDVTQRLLNTLGAGGGKVAKLKKRAAPRRAKAKAKTPSRARKVARRTVRKSAKKAAPKRRAQPKRKAARKPARKARVARPRRKSKR
jgi:adenylate kinase